MNPETENDNAEVLAIRRDYPMTKDPRTMQKTLARIEETLGGRPFSPLMLSRIKVPSGDDQYFKVETPTGVERAATITGTIVAFRAARAYWQKPYGVGRVGPPDCSSKDGFLGEGDPGGECTSCPLAAYNSARAADGSAGPGQACKELRQLLILLPGQILPHLLAVPPTSLANFSKYSLNLLSSGLDYWGVTTKLTLEPATNQGGITYARVRFQLYREMPENVANALVPYHECMRDLLKPMTMETTGYEISEPDNSGGPRNQDDDPDRPF